MINGGSTTPVRVKHLGHLTFTLFACADRTFLHLGATASGLNKVHLQMVQAENEFLVKCTVYEYRFCLH